MEMNTRLQVEHPVTEEITGIDIVKEQIRIAAGEPLPVGQDDVKIEGHAIECRINAEDPKSGFKPSPGTIREFYVPSDGVPGSRPRLETHVEAGYRVPPHYDSLIAKVITFGKDRTSAINAMIATLHGARIKGVRTTVPFHLQVLADEKFREGDYDVGTAARILESAKAGKD
jgi:acetyl-CoA carboxylase biotin carboxylase subunit